MKTRKGSTAEGEVRVFGTLYLVLGIPFFGLVVTLCPIFKFLSWRWNEPMDAQTEWSLGAFFVLSAVGLGVAFRAWRSDGRRPTQAPHLPWRRTARAAPWLAVAGMMLGVGVTGWAVEQHDVQRAQRADHHCWYLRDVMDKEECMARALDCLQRFQAEDLQARAGMVTSDVVMKCIGEAQGAR